MLKPKQRQSKCLEGAKDVAKLILQNLHEPDGDVNYQEQQEDLESAGFPKYLSIFNIAK